MFLISRKETGINYSQKYTFLLSILWNQVNAASLFCLFYFSGHHFFSTALCGGKCSNKISFQHSIQLQLQSLYQFLVH